MREGDEIYSKQESKEQMTLRCARRRWNRQRARKQKTNDTVRREKEMESTASVKRTQKPNQTTTPPPTKREFGPTPIGEKKTIRGSVVIFHLRYGKSHILVKGAALKPLWQRQMGSKWAHHDPAPKNRFLLGDGNHPQAKQSKHQPIPKQIQKEPQEITDQSQKSTKKSVRQNSERQSN